MGKTRKIAGKTRFFEKQIASYYIKYQLTLCVEFFIIGMMSIFRPVHAADETTIWIKMEVTDMKMTFQPKKGSHAKVHGFRARMATPGGRKVLAARRAKGRKVLTVQ